MKEQKTSQPTMTSIYCEEMQVKFPKLVLQSSSQSSQATSDNFTSSASHSYFLHDSLLLHLLWASCSKSLLPNSQDPPALLDYFSCSPQSPFPLMSCHRYCCSMCPVLWVLEYVLCDCYNLALIVGLERTHISCYGHLARSFPPLSSGL